MCEIICITNRLLCSEDFEVRMEKIAKAHPSAVVLREKDLEAYEYRLLAEKIIKICETYDVQCILHYFTDVASALGCSSVHLPLPKLKMLSSDQREVFSTIGCSCHCKEDASEAEMMGCRYIIAGHIFTTDCKKGLMPRGTDFLKSVCSDVSIPVYAIGGINESNISQLSDTGARGVCLMSSLMTCKDPGEYIQKLKKSWNN